MDGVLQIAHRSAPGGQPRRSEDDRRGGDLKEYSPGRIWSVALRQRSEVESTSRRCPPIIYRWITRQARHPGCAGTSNQFSPFDRTLVGGRRCTRHVWPQSFLQTAGRQQLAVTLSAPLHGRIGLADSGSSRYRPAPNSWRGGASQSTGHRGGPIADARQIIWKTGFRSLALMADKAGFAAVRADPWHDSSARRARRAPAGLAGVASPVRWRGLGHRHDETGLATAWSPVRLHEARDLIKLREASEADNREC